MLVAFLWASQAWSFPPKFGPEFTFTNKKLNEAWSKMFKDGIPMADQMYDLTNTDENIEMHAQWRAAIKKMCEASGECVVRDIPKGDKHGPSFRVKYKDGWWYQVGVDMGVIEVQTKPGTHDEFLGQKSRLDSDIFQVAESLGISAAESGGLGHLNMDLTETFDGDSILFRNFLVDQYNHNEFWNIFGDGSREGESMVNGPPMSSLPLTEQQTFRKIIGDRMAGKSAHGKCGNIAYYEHSWATKS